MMPHVQSISLNYVILIMWHQQTLIPGDQNLSIPYHHHNIIWSWCKSHAHNLFVNIIELSQIKIVNLHLFLHENIQDHCNLHFSWDYSFKVSTVYLHVNIKQGKILHLSKPILWFEWNLSRRNIWHWQKSIQRFWTHCMFAEGYCLQRNMRYIYIYILHVSFCTFTFQQTYNVFKNSTLYFHSVQYKSNNNQRNIHPDLHIFVFYDYFIKQLLTIHLNEKR